MDAGVTGPRGSLESGEEEEKKAGEMKEYEIEGKLSNKADSLREQHFGHFHLS